VPAAVGVKAADEVPRGTLAAVKTMIVHAESLYAVYVTVPEGLKPPVRDDRSDAEPPRVIVEGVTVELIVGLAFDTVKVSPVAPHLVVTALLFPSPLYVAMKKYVPVAVGVKAADEVPSGTLEEVKTSVAHAESLYAV